MWSYFVALDIIGSIPKVHIPLVVIDSSFAIPWQWLEIFARTAESRNFFEIFIRSEVSLENVDLERDKIAVHFLT